MFTELRRFFLHKDFLERFCRARKRLFSFGEKYKGEIKIM
ncbi:hypothetical protein GCWU000321_01693 [Dialister invisus DSM 15470]|uniref:Uncharacterized protein n=1 Tax=Dialister invisus DSM 15470 TaxID=592028 RepID=C9LQ61_9FIRM|nr:hypothetical protein GCWU000321_01693 [Dialister invisus DSM 15470]